MKTFRHLAPNAACGYRQFVRLPQVLVSPVLLLVVALTGCGGGGGTLPPSTPTPTSPQSFSLVVSISGNGLVTSSPGGINCGNSCNGSFSSGSQVTLQATPATGYLFTGWTGACSGSATSCTVTMNQNQAVSAVFSMQPEGVAVVSGQLVIAGTNTPFLPRGFTTNGVVYPTQYAGILCTQYNVAPGSRVAQWLEDAQTAITAPPLPGLPYNASFQAMVQDWHANSVRFQVSQGALEYEYENALSVYTDMVRSAIAQARAAGLIVFISMNPENYGCTPYENGAIQKLPDTHTEHAWAQLLNSTLTSDKGIVLEVMNEPDTNIACNTGLPYPDADWTDWATGCGTEPEQGMLTVGQYLRTLAPNNVLVFDADESAGTFAGFVVPSGMPSNSAYTIHPYLYNQGSVNASINAWDSWFGDFEQSGHAVIVTEWNEDYKCASDPNQTITDEFIQTYLPQHSIGLIGYSWDGPYWGSGYLVNSYDYPANTANYHVVDPDNSGCAQDGGNELLQEFQTQAAQ